jgi:hypothetical protein
VVDALTVSPASADFTLEASGSDDGFVSDDTGWTTSLSSLSGKRYLKLRLSIATSDVNNPTMADSATLSYTSTQITEFNMKAAGCASVARAAGESGSSGARALIPFLILLVFLGGLILCARRVPHRS